MDGKKCSVSLSDAQEADLEEYVQEFMLWCSVVMPLSRTTLMLYPDYIKITEIA